uniref:Cytochrome c oxidase subunit 7B, mitochondrial n=2 Tax=Leptobrachium leishanense TaxID=445787 RepID=A0A8C5PE58_9ANUR
MRKQTAVTLLSYRVGHVSACGIPSNREDTKILPANYNYREDRRHLRAAKRKRRVLDRISALSPSWFFNLHFSSRVRETEREMFPLVRSALSLTARGFQRSVSRQSHHRAEANFHDKYGNAILISGVAFCTSVWAYVITQTGIVWNLSPIGKVTPKAYKEE